MLAIAHAHADGITLTCTVTAANQSLCGCPAKGTCVSLNCSSGLGRTIVLSRMHSPSGEQLQSNFAVMSIVTHLLATPHGSPAFLDHGHFMPSNVHVCMHLKRNLHGCILKNMPSASLLLATPLAWLWVRRPIRSPVLADTHPLHNNSHALPPPVFKSHHTSS